MKRLYNDGENRSRRPVLKIPVHWVITDEVDIGILKEKIDQRIKHIKKLEA